MEKQIYVTTDLQMIEIGKRIGEKAFKNMVIAMQGDLGAGKTTMTKGIGVALGIQKVINSPTFTILKIYEGNMKLYHMDVYRISNDSQDDYLEEYFYMDGVCVIEWAQNISDFLPDERLDIQIEIDEDNNRLVTIKSDSKNYDEVIKGVVL